MSKPRFKFLTGDINWQQYGAKFISQKFNNGEFDYFFVIEVMNWEDILGEREAKEIGKKYNIYLFVVAPSQVSEKEIDAAKSCCGCEDRKDLSVECLVEVLHSYGIYVVIFQIDTNNIKKGMKAAKEKAYTCEAFTFGFDLDKPVNGIGTTGWDALKGNITAGLYYPENQNNDNVKLCKKISGIA
jgi:hypothetical protein